MKIEFEKKNAIGQSFAFRFLYATPTKLQPIETFDRNLCHFNLHFDIYCSCSSFCNSSSCAHEREMFVGLCTFIEIDRICAEQIYLAIIERIPIFNQYIHDICLVCWCSQNETNCRLLVFDFYLFRSNPFSGLVSSHHSFRMVLLQKYQHIFVFLFT